MHFSIIMITIFYGANLSFAEDLYREKWRVSKPDIHPPYMVDCVNCNDEEVGILIDCQPEQKTIEIMFSASAGETGNDGQIVPALLSLDNKDFRRNIQLKLYELNGYTPILTLKFKDKMLDTIKTAKILKNNLNGRTDTYAAKGLAPTFSQFLKHCTK